LDDWMIVWCGKLVGKFKKLSYAAAEGDSIESKTHMMQASVSNEYGK